MFRLDEHAVAGQLLGQLVGHELAGSGVLRNADAAGLAKPGIRLADHRHVKGLAAVLAADKGVRMLGLKLVRQADMDVRQADMDAVELVRQDMADQIILGGALHREDEQTMLGIICPP